MKPNNLDCYESPSFPVICERVNTLPIPTINYTHTHTCVHERDWISVRYHVSFDLFVYKYTITIY